MQGFRRKLGVALAALGVGVCAWALVVWQWQDPFTGLYTRWQQHKLADAYAARERAYRAPDASNLAAERRAIAAAAARYRSTTHRGEPIGRISIPRLGLNMLLVDGADHDSLTKGPGRDLHSFMPGQNRLVYIAGHRTTYLAPFAHIERLRRGDPVTIRVPYGTFDYVVVRHRIVAADDLTVLRSPRHEQLELQACHPRFFATHRYIVYAKLVRVSPRAGAPFAVAAQR
jgi:sortase A